jgi:hypothetical protein
LEYIPNALGYQTNGVSTLIWIMLVQWNTPFDLGCLSIVNQQTRGFTARFETAADPSTPRARRRHVAMRRVRAHRIPEKHARICRRLARGDDARRFRENKNCARSVDRAPEATSDSDPARPMTSCSGETCANLSSFGSAAAVLPQKGGVIPQRKLRAFRRRDD